MASTSVAREKDGIIAEGYVPIEGYTLEQQIGRGGFGEVWRVNAPGNLKKAIKFIFGHHNEKYAARELRSLERIRLIRHPFLLTLERFEVVDDRLVIVTELADGSLEDIYKRHRAAGSCGIPRDVLLKNLGDTADGLDYLHQEFGLQHLDVKPANLLIVGGHVKVADFGLLKDLGDVDCSVVGGLTPIYAPPELFDGRPSFHSDQYSLAVLYQEMLTGTRPFAGRTIAQLATQHVHSTPNLEPLPPRDRNTVARALEKDPDRRFSSCQEFIEELRQSSRNDETTAEAKPIVVKAKVGDLPRIEDQHDPSVTGGKRLLVIALGGTGSDCLNALHRTALARCTETTIDAVAIDTDRDSWSKIVVDDQYKNRFRFRKIHAPLKSATEYRRDATSRLASISRRWLYNVPKDRTTQSVRPMGRLAMVDHGPTISNALRDAISDASDSKNADDLHVFVVGSISGGTGGGIYIDVVHQLRHLLDEQGLQDSAITSLMSCQPFGAEDASRLAYHNTHASLIEINHFLKPENGYPGDAGAGFESVPAARTPLRRLYLFPGQADAKFGCRPVQSITNYLWNSSHEAATLLEEARGSNNHGESVNLPSVRTVGIISVGRSQLGLQYRMTMGVVDELLCDWLGTPKEAKSASPQLMRRISRRSGLTLEYMFGSILRTLASPDAPNVTDPARFDASPFDGSMDYIAAGIGNQLQRELSISLGDRTCNLSVLIGAVQHLQSHCESLFEQWSVQQREKVASLGSDQVEKIISIGQYVVTQVISECHHLLQRLECLAAIIAVATVELHRSDFGDDPWNQIPMELKERRGKLVENIHQATVNSFLVRPLNDPNSNLTAAAMTEQLAAAIEPHLAAFIQELSDRMDGQGSSQFGAKFSGDGSVNVDSSMGGNITEMPHSYSMTGGVATQSVHAPGVVVSADQFQTADSIEDALVIVRPPLIEFGGDQRMILLVPNQAQRLELEPIVRKLHDGSLSVAIRQGITPTLIQEVQSIPLQGLVTRLEVIGGDSQITSRLASRIDVNWTSCETRG